MKYRYYSETMGNVVPTLFDVVKQAIESYKHFKVVDLKWKYNRKGF